MTEQEIINSKHQDYKWLLEALQKCDEEAISNHYYELERFMSYISKLAEEMYLKYGVVPEAHFTTYFNPDRIPWNPDTPYYNAFVVFKVIDRDTLFQAKMARP